MTTLLADIDDGLGKTAYQTYTVTVGLETFEALTPLTKTSQFEKALNESFKALGRHERVGAVRAEVMALGGQLTEV